MKVEGTPKPRTPESGPDGPRTDWGRSVERHAKVGRFDPARGEFRGVSPTALAIQPRPA